MAPIILAFSGRIGSGKTSVSKRIARDLDYRYASFSSYLHKLARSGGLATPSRRDLQRIAEAEIEKGWEQFCLGLLRDASWQSGESIVLDGVRHILAVQTLKRIGGTDRFALVWIEIPDGDLAGRLQKKGIASLDELRMIERHPAEGDVERGLKETADLIVDGSRSLDEIASSVERWITRSS